MDLPTVFVIFGATGNLAEQKLIPALFHLYRNGQLPRLFQIVGFSRRELSQDDFRQFVLDILVAQFPRASRRLKDRFVRMCVYQQGTFEDLKGFRALAIFLGQRDGEWKVCSNKLFHLAVPPQHYEVLFRNLKASGLTIPCSPKEGWTRVLVEKPFGKNLRTAKALDALLGKLFKEEQVYRIDHYLGKETVQNILAFRFSNSFLAPAWNSTSIEQIRIQLFEKGRVGRRGNFYEGVGALRDVGQNHVLQLLALFVMENPGVFEGAAIRKARAEALSKLHIFSPKEVAKYTARAQYKGYPEETGVLGTSHTETAFRVEAKLTTPTWRGVPFILESGKAMEKDRVAVELVFRHKTPCLCPQGIHYKNVLRYEIQPHEGIHLSLWVKRPGGEMKLEERAFSFDYKEAFRGHAFPDAYERLLLSAIQGDQTLFVSTEEILAGWRFVDPIYRVWNKEARIRRYAPGTYPFHSDEA